MAETVSLVARLRHDFPDIGFEPGDGFRWSPRDNSVYYVAPLKKRDGATLLHEAGHALLGHTDFSHDINLIKMEREAWSRALQLAKTYDVTIDDDAVEEALDSYRDWLDARSRCPNCGQTGVQESEGIYHCPICRVGWRVNDARQCGLRRYRLEKD